MRTLTEIERLVNYLPASWRRFCPGGPCACIGCVNRAPREAERLTAEEWQVYLAAHGRQEPCSHCFGTGKIMRLV